MANILLDRQVRNKKRKHTLGNDEAGKLLPFTVTVNVQSVFLLPDGSLAA